MYYSSNIICQTFEEDPDSNSSGSNDSSDSKQTPTQTPTEQQTPEITEPTGSDNTQPLAEVPLFWYIRNYCRFCKFSTSK